MKKKLTLSLASIFMIFMMGCESFVEVEKPNSQLTGNVVFQDRTTANAAVSQVYIRLRDSGWLTGSTAGSGSLLGMYADELTYFGAANENIALVFSNNLVSITPIAQQKWRESYHQIYGANAIIEGCQNNSNLSNADKNQFIGEALFIRALIHFFLANCYGDIPYVTTTDYQINRLVSRISINQVYQLILSDLDQAISLLPDQYPTPERVRANKSTALALKARVHLYNGDWSLASEAATSIINNPLYVWETDISKIFLKDCSATIWQFSPNQPGNNTPEASGFVFQNGPPPFIGLSSELYNAFDPNDLRRNNWIRTVTNGTSTWYHAFKYKQNTPTTSAVEYSILFRLGEIHLIRAEARARQGELMGAQEDINKIRSLAGLPDTSAQTVDELITTIMNERRFELFTEHGHRFFDLKRNGNIDAVLPLVKPGWNSTDKLWPIPESELLANPNMTQNPGY